MVRIEVLLLEYRVTDSMLHYHVGFDRLMAIICNASRLKEVIVFPKSINGRDLYVGAPSKVEDAILKDYHITTID